jgi:hypothetical protein
MLYPSRSGVLPFVFRLDTEEAFNPQARSRQTHHHLDGTVVALAPRSLHDGLIAASPIGIFCSRRTCRLI